LRQAGFCVAGNGVGEITMERREARVVFGAMFFASLVAIGVAPAAAQTFQPYRCADGTRFIAAFYQYDSRAYLQIDGRAVTLAKRLNWSGSRYSGEGITLTITRAGVAVKHARRPTTACEVDIKQP
jgi:membrane-bound inhibitor of C-type lysozyme